MQTSLPWVDGLTIGAALQKTVERFPSHDAVVFPRLKLRWTWTEFSRQVERASRAVLAMGIAPGEHVAVWATNVPEWLILQFALAKIGVVMVNINPAYRPFELKYVLRQSDAVALFLVDRFKSSDYFAMLAEVCPELAHSQAGSDGSDNHSDLTCRDYPKLRRVVAMQGTPPAGIVSWDDAMALGSATSDEALAIAERNRSCDEPINIQYTSGTTGFPKAAMLSHRNLLLNAYYVGDCQLITERDRICIPVPFYHCFGCVLGTLCASVTGAAMIIPNTHFHPEATLDAIEQERATVIYGVPTMFISQLEDESFTRRNLTSLRTGIMAGSPCPIEVMRQVIDRMGAREMTIAYGQTESSPVITQTRTDDPVQLRVETVGRPIPRVEVKIVDPGTGIELGNNVQGELCCRGHVVMLGYYGNPEATAIAIDEAGWLHTGDLAVRLDSGYYKITGRIKDMVIRGGENIYPREIEEFLFTHPAIEQASVVGVPDDKYGEELCAWIKLKAGMSLTPDELRQFCRENLAHFKVPKYVSFVDNFPQTVTGKIQKFKIRDTMIEQLGLRVQETA